MGSLAVHLSRREPPAGEQVSRMLEAAPHRGRESGIGVLGQVALGITNDSTWVTAWLARSNGRMVAFNGALDNDAELRSSLAAEGAPPPSENTPAGTILAAFEHWGDAFAERLRGSFTLALTDGREVVCCRDQFGAKPFFYRDNAEGFFAANEVKQVIAGSGIRREPNMEHLVKVLYGGIIDSTAYEGVARIPKGHLCRVGSRVGLRLNSCWNPSDYVETGRMSAADAMEGTVEALDRAVRRQLTGCDVLLLSGGLDSPSLAAFASRATGLSNPVQALTSRYPDHPSVDEYEWTRMAADHVGMPLHSFVAKAGSMDNVEHWVRILDGPVDIVSIPETAEAYSEARAYGARTVLNGEVAEFLFDGRGHLLDHLLIHGRFRAASRVLGWSRSKGRSATQLGREVARAISPTWLLIAKAKRRRRGQLRAIPPWLDERRFLRQAIENTQREPLPIGKRWIWMQTAALEGPGVGFEADEICAAACGVDTRRPFADVDLWQFVLSIPADVKFPTERSKPLLRESMRGLLPDALIDRRDKTVFNEFHVATADYPKLRSILGNCDHRFDGVDYELLARNLTNQNMPAREIQWARDLARIHVFLNQWS